MLLLLILCEYLLLSKAYVFTTPSPTIWVTVSLFIILLAIGCCLKVYSFDKWMIKGFLGNSITGGYTAIFFLIVFLITCAFVPALIRDYIADTSLTLWGLIIGIAAIPLEVLIYPSSYSSTRCSMEEREVLVSAISFKIPKKNETASFELSAFQNDGFRYPFMKCPKLTEVWVIVSKEFINNAHACFPNIENDKKVAEQYVQNIFKDEKVQDILKDKKIDIHISDPVEYNDFDKCYEVAKEIFNKIGKEKAKKTIVNISPGTAMIGSALAMFAIQGNRILAYNKQNVNDEIPFAQSSANVLSMKELIEEMIIEIQNSRQA